jgi:hypothetical protein
MSKNKAQPDKYIREHDILSAVLASAQYTIFRSFYDK